MNKIEQVAPIDAFWAIDAVYAAQAVVKLQELDVGECARLQAAHRESQEEPAPYEMSGSTAVIAISGPMTKKPTSASYLFGGTSTVLTRQAIRAAVDDPSVESILLHIDSPSGQVSGTAELADDVREASLCKPTAAYIEDLGASAAYWVASQATAIFANRMARVGSIGVYSVVEDWSGRLAQLGVKAHLLTTGPFKGAGQFGIPVTPAQLAEWQRQVDSICSEFKLAVCLGRILEPEQVDALADGRTYPADEAADLGLIDRVCTLEACLSTFAKATADKKTISDGRVSRSMAAINGAHTKKGETHMADSEKPGLGARLIAFLRGEGIDVDAGGGSTNRIDPTLQKQLDQAAESQKAIALGLAREQAKSFASALTTGPKAKAFPAEHAAIADLYFKALCADGGGAPLMKDGALQHGPMLFAVQEAYAWRPTHSFGTQTVADRPEAALTLDPMGGGAQQLSDSRRKELLGKSGLGRSVLSREGR